MESERSDGYFTQLLHDTSLNDINDDLDMATTALNQDGNTPSPQTATGGLNKNSHRGDNFASEEDLLLVNGWLSISLDAIVGSDQKFKTLWGRIHNYYHECKKPNHQERSMHSLSNRWSAIQRSVNKFCGCLAQIENLRPSGHSEEDKVEQVDDAKTGPNLYGFYADLLREVINTWNGYTYSMWDHISIFHTA